MDNDIIKKLSQFAFVSSIIGICTLGVCPAFGVMGLVVPYVFGKKGVKLNGESAAKCKKAQITGAVSLALFPIDLVIAFILL